MKAATLNTIKTELNLLERNKLIELCLRMAKYKVDNKELLSYLLFDSFNTEGFVKEIKSKIDEQFLDLNQSNHYYTKKGLRRILRGLNKYIKHIGSKQTEADLLIYFCSKIKKARIPLSKSVILNNLYLAQIKRINKAIDSLDEDLRYDFKEDIEELQNISASM